jgi:hypothetical protein
MAKKKTEPDFGGTLGRKAPVRVASGQGSAQGKTRRLTLDLNPEAHQQFRVKAAELDTTMKQLLIGFVEALADGDENAAKVAQQSQGKRR